MHGASAVFVVKDGNGTACIMANFSAAFLTNYDTNSGFKVGQPRAACVACACVLRLISSLKKDTTLTQLFSRMHISFWAHQ